MEDYSRSGVGGADLSSTATTSREPRVTALVPHRVSRCFLQYRSSARKNPISPCRKLFQTPKTPRPPNPPRRSGNLLTPGAFNFTAKYKYNAWKKLEGMSKEDAQLKYIELFKAVRFAHEALSDRRDSKTPARKTRPSASPLWRVSSLCLLANVQAHVQLPVRSRYNLDMQSLISELRWACPRSFDSFPATATLQAAVWMAV